MRGERARYGIDAPGVMIGLLAAGGSLEGAAAVAGLWTPAPGWVAMLLAAAGLVPLGLGLAMAVYALLGKARTRELVLELCRLRGDETVLDVGTGRGFLAIGAAKRLPVGHVVGIDVWRTSDLSGNGPEAAAANARLDGVADRVEFRTADGRRLDFDDASFDVVVSLLCLHNIDPASDRATACREIARVLKPGGRVVIGDYVPTGGYARALAEAGLTCVVSRPRFGTALSLMWTVTAAKPALGGVAASG